MNSNDYLTGMLQSVQETCPGVLDTAVLNTLFPSLFLALVARDANIIVSTPQPAELQRATAKILSSVFGLQTKRVKVRFPQTPHQLLESLFLPMTPSSSSSSSHKRKPSRNSLPRSISAPRPSSSHLTEGSDSTAPPPSASRFPRHKTDPLPRNLDSQPPNSLRLPQAVVISSLERAGRAAQLALASVLRTRRVILDNVVWNLPIGFFVVYVSPVGDGFERPAIHTTLLDHFALSTTLVQTTTPIPASPSPRLRPLSLSSSARNQVLLPYDRLPSPEQSRVSPLISHYINALLTAVRHHPELDGTFLTARCVKDVERLVHASSLAFRGDGETMVSEMHVRRVVPPILVHRLRVRDSPREQIMGVLWEGAGARNWGQPPQETQQERRTIKTILAEVLTEV